jgi:N6-L-threonylcarbamoyladenine synthase
MSFSGLKTALLRARDAIIAEKGGITVQDRRDLCAGFQAAVAEVLAKSRPRGRWRCANAVRALAVAGGVAANMAIRAGLETVAAALACRSLPRPCGFAPTMPR